ncbi:MAG: acyl-CoA thioesterase [Bacteroidota bacterium]
MNRKLRSKRVIRFQDCDPFNHLNNARYIDYFINTREDQLVEHYGLDVFSEMKTSGKSWVVTSNQISYMRPAKTMESVLIDSQLIHFDDHRLKVEMMMWNEDETEIKAIIWMTFTHVNVIESSLEKHSKTLMDLFRSVAVDISDQSFEERIKNLLSSNKIKQHADA